MNKYIITAIEWDTDGEEVELPTTWEYLDEDGDIENPEDEEDVERVLADKLSDEFGWCVTAFSVKHAVQSTPDITTPSTHNLRTQKMATNSTDDKNKTDEALIRFLAMSPIERMEIIDNMVISVIGTLEQEDAAKKKVNASLKEVTAARNGVITATSGQLKVLETTLAAYAEPITEDTWDKLFRANVADRLDESTVNGAPRYNGRASRDVMVNTIKVATMGLTLARQDRLFAPSYAVQGNLKKYADEVRPKLQAAIDPATNKPRLRTIVQPPKPPKRLPRGVRYILIGCDNEDPNKSVNTVIGAADSFEHLKGSARRAADKYKRFVYCTARIEPLTLEPEEVEERPLENVAVIATTYSSSDEHASA